MRMAGEIFEEWMHYYPLDERMYHARQAMPHLWVLLHLKTASDVLAALDIIHCCEFESSSAVLIWEAGLARLPTG